MLSISQPSNDDGVSPPFDVSGSCTQGHTVTVTIDGTNPVLQGTSKPASRTGAWSVSFDSCPAGTYSITATCGNPSESTTVTNITVS